MRVVTMFMQGFYENAKPVMPEAIICLCGSARKSRDAGTRPLLERLEAFCGADPRTATHELATKKAYPRSESLPLGLGCGSRPRLVPNYSSVSKPRKIGSRTTESGEPTLNAYDRNQRIQRQPDLAQAIYAVMALLPSQPWALKQTCPNIQTW